MNNDMLIAGQAIARALMPTENSIDDAIVKQCALLSTIAAGRLRTGIAAEATQGPIDSAVQGLASLSAARAFSVACHQQLATLRDAMGGDPSDFGCDFGKTNPTAERRLRAA